MINRALEGVKVADFTWAIAGTLLSTHLAGYGATSVKIELPETGDPLRHNVPYKDGQSGVNRSGYFAYLNTNKYSLSLDLNHPKGREVAWRVVSWADVVAENFRPGVMEKWGFGYEDIKKVKPDIIMLRTSNQGQTGPNRERAGLGNHLNALIGFVNATGWPDREPVNMMLAYTDYTSPNMAVAAVVAALDYRRRTGKGQLLDFSQFEAGLQFLLPAIMDYTVNNRVNSGMGNACPYAAPHGVYRCKGDDCWCAIAIFGDEEWEAFCEVIGNPAWTRETRFATSLGRKESEEELNGLIGEWTVNFDADQVMMRMQGAGVTAGVVKSPKDIFQDPQLRFREFFWLIDHKEIGPLHHLGEVAMLSKTPAKPRMPAPCLGEHTRFVCREVLGMSEGEFENFMKDGAFG